MFEQNHSISKKISNQKWMDNSPLQMLNSYLFKGEKPSSYCIFFVSLDRGT